MIFVFVSCSKATVFSDPDCASETVDEVIYGDNVDMLSRFNGFLKIITDYGYVGWVFEKSVTEFESVPTHYVNASFADVLPTEGYFYKPRLTLPFGAKTEKIGEGARFSVCKTPFGNGYIRKELLEPIKKPRTEAEMRYSITETAKKFLGVQYRWGGRTFSGIDCSGLCFNAYRFNGIDIWRDADITRSPNLKRIDHKTAKNADLMFFKGHIAMYLGNGMIIHSSASRGMAVIENYENNDYLKEIYICTGTVFDE